ncbi:unnamed protein product [Clavelina lepadiformis]|uniref:Branchpoint-bridging protein n=1 Tax=Clavelina lepadiformis TaxID=159417 RepID=A0ABP0GLH4_CLALP
MADQVVDTKYLPELMAEKDSIDPSFVHAVRLISHEIQKLKNPSRTNPNNDEENEKCEFLSCFPDKNSKSSMNIKVPTDEYPNFNFVGRLLGPGGATLKGIQEVTNTRISILGRGSMRDQKKMDDLIKSGDPKYSHLKHPLHVKIMSNAPLGQAHINMGRAALEIVKLLQIDDEEYLSQSMAAAAPRGGRMGQRGTASGRGMMRGHPRGGARGAGRGTAARGGNRGSGRGSAAQRGSRGRGATNMAKTMSVALQADPYAQGDEYGFEYVETYEGYGGEYADAAYDAAYGSEAFVDPYANGSYAMDGTYTDAYAYSEAYDPYSNGAGDSSGQYPVQKAFRGKMRGRGRGGAKPY